MCICVYMCIDVNRFVYKCMYVITCIQAYISAYMWIYVYICILYIICICIYVYVQMFTCIDVYVCIYVCCLKRFLCLFQFPSGLPPLPADAQRTNAVEVLRFELRVVVHPQAGALPVAHRVCDQGLPPALAPVPHKVDL